MAKATYTVAVKRPFRLDLTVLVMRRRAQNVVSDWDGHSYRRILAIGGTPVKVTVSQGGTDNNPHLTITLESHSKLTLDQQIEAQITTLKMLGATADVESFSDYISQDPIIWNMAGKYLGVKPARFPTVFEALISAISCQEQTMEACILLTNRLSIIYGLAFNDGNKVRYAFPRPEDLIDATEASLVRLGFTARNASTIIELTRGILLSTINLDQLELATKEEATAYLSNINGVESWTVEYVLLRGLGMLDVYPVNDIRQVDILQRVLALGSIPKVDEVRILSEAWHPFEGFVYYHLLLERLRLRGFIL